MKVWLFLVLVLIVLSCEAGKKKKKKGKTSSSESLKNLFLRQRPTKPPPVPVKEKKVDLHNVDFTSINTTDQFYEVFNLPRLRQHSHGSGGSDHSTSIQKDSHWNCRTRETLVHLPAPAYGDGIYFPSCATVNRCSGCCGVSNLECKPVDVQQVQVDYYHVKPNGVVAEKSMLLDEHNSCKCQCSQTADSCIKDRQDWNPHQCQCECLPKHQENELGCPQKGNFQFDAKSCSCVCKTKRHCDDNPNLEWSDVDCACVCKNKKCPSRQYLDKNTCNCVSHIVGQRQ